MVAEKSRGEVGELRSQLMRLSGGGSSPEKIALKRELFRKLIMLGTIGQDMSSLFMQVSAEHRRQTSCRTRVAQHAICAHRALDAPSKAKSMAPYMILWPLQVITCAASDSQDIVLKKSLYQYITTYANANPELMLLTINMLLKDCQDQDPTIRGLALRSLCSLTISNLTEYLVRCGRCEQRDRLLQRPGMCRALGACVACGAAASGANEAACLYVASIATTFVSLQLYSGQPSPPLQMSPIQRGLEDRQPYVRRTAVMGVLKVYNFDEGAVQNAGKSSLTYASSTRQRFDWSVASRCHARLRAAISAD